MLLLNFQNPSSIEKWSKEGSECGIYDCKINDCNVLNPQCSIDDWNFYKGNIYECNDEDPDWNAYIVPIFNKMF